MSNPVAMITGAARGIGLACAKALASHGFDIVVADILDSADAVVQLKEIGVEAIGVNCDISSSDARHVAIDEVKEKFGKLNVLINNAGVAPKVRADILEAGEESYDFVMNINLRGPYFLTQLAANWMVEQKKVNPDQSFTIINISSISAETASPARGEYCLSKAGVSMMTKLYAARLADEGILVFEIRPGIVMTDMTSVVKDKYDKLIADGITPIRKWVMPEDVGAAAASCAIGGIPMATGQVINVDAGFHLSIL